MPRKRYYRRYYKATPKKKWASNIIQDSLSTSTSSTLVINSTQTSLPTPVIVKCGNFKVQGDIMVSYSSTSSARVIPLNFFVLYVPEGVSPSDALIGAHPEWIMGWTAIESPVAFASQNNTVSGNKFSLTSRLKRNLNSGDRVVAILQSRDSSVTAQAVFTCQYWTCAN